MRCPDCNYVLKNPKKCSNEKCGWEKQKKEGVVIDQVVRDCFRCHSPIYRDFVHVGVRRDFDGDIVYQNVRIAHRHCIHQKDFRDEAVNQFLREHPEFNVKPTREDVSSVIQMTKQFMKNNPPPKREKRKPMIADDYERELLQGRSEVVA